MRTSFDTAPGRLLSGAVASHPDLVSRLEGLGVSPRYRDGRWEELWRWVDGLCHEVEELRGAQGEVSRERSSFENLFRTSPVPIMQQDYTRLELWMEELRATGVASLAEAMGEDIESIRAVVPKIRMVAANPAAQRAVGLPPEEMLGPIDPRIVNPGSETGWLGQIRAVWEGRAVAHSSFTASTADGQPYDAESVLAAPLIDGVPDFSRAVFTIIDVTPHRNEERRMQDLMEAKDRFLASVSHEIRTPLTAILGFARLLDEDADLSWDERKTMISAVADHAQEVSDLVDDLLVAARVELGQVQVLSVPVDLGDQIGQVLAAGGSFTRRVRYEPAPQAVRVVCDPARLRQILRNLLTNAERYGGPDVAIELGWSGSTARVAVVDDGPGVPPDQWERIFEPYHRAHHTPGQPDSVGIGLAISRQLAELMHGQLEYERRAGRSVFLLTLPAAG